MLGPIFLREWLTVPRRPRHYLTRALFLGTLWVLLLTVWQTTVGWNRPPTLGDQARFGLLAFQVLIYVQLALLLFFSALSAAGTIAQEKDRRTFLLLLLPDRHPRRGHPLLAGRTRAVSCARPGHRPACDRRRLLARRLPIRGRHAPRGGAAQSLGHRPPARVESEWRAGDPS